MNYNISKHIFTLAPLTNLTYSIILFFLRITPCLKDKGEHNI